jgi:GT2 family glycosyltransferase/glycosyltransferase involved in cell wall biosynthesis
MHRSGTSMVAKLLRACGLYLGRPEDLYPPCAENPDGHWEYTKLVESNNELLNSLGGAWDSPPALPRGWHERPELAQHRAKARLILGDFRGNEPWGWKDPRNCLTLPFWLDILPDARVVICVRNPLEVALSLHLRNNFSFQMSLGLWRTYSRHVLAATDGRKRLVTHYEAYFEDARSALRRVADGLQLPVAENVLADCCRGVSHPHRHHRFTTRQLLDADPPAEVVQLYEQLCAEAGRPVEDVRGWLPASAPRPGDDAGVRLNVAALQLELRRQELANQKAVEARLRATIEEQASELASALAAAADEEARHLNEVRDLHWRVEECEAARAEALAQRVQALEAQLQHLVDQPYREIVVKVRRAVRQVVPAGATVAVVSKGDPELLELGPRRAYHLPADVAGDFTGGNPLDDGEAIRCLEDSRARGADFLIIPATAFWWLDHYHEFARHLDRYRAVYDNDACAIYTLIPTVPDQEASPPPIAAPAPPLADLSAEREARYRDLIDRVREVVRATVPADATVLVVSKGDDALLVLDGRRAWHFPRAESGLYAGHHPRDGADAVRRLEATKPRRGGYFLIPQPYFWWLTHYAEFARHLEENYETVWRDQTCVLFSLRGKGPAAVLRQWVGRLRQGRPRATAMPETLGEATPAAGAQRHGPDIKRPEDRLRPSLVTVVVPVYNAYEETRTCLASLVRHGRHPHRVLLIDDRSIDERVWPLLQAYAAAHDHFVATRNDVNLGFTATVNRGCALAPGDVVLLNSDTEVTADWLEKLSACASSGVNVGTVTAVSNAAGAFSLPINNADNEIPPPFSADDVASLVERLSQWVRPAVPTGNGFCMYVTRRALREVGPFDEANFPRGYGEENDFCRRCAAVGMSNLIDDRTFIRHKGTASFLGSKAAHAARGLEAMRRLHLDYDRLVEQWLRNDPLDSLRAAVRDAIGGGRHGGSPARPDGPCVLFVVHDGAGGTIHMVEDLAVGLRGRFRCVVLKTAPDRWTLHEHASGSLKPSRRYHFTAPWRAKEPLDAERLSVLRSLLRDFRIDLVHVNHLIANGPEVIEVAGVAGLPVIFSFHDFYTVWPAAYLGGDTGCLEAALGLTEEADGLDDVGHCDYRRRIEGALESCDALVVPTGSTREALEDRLPFLAGRDVRVIEHGRDVERAALAARPRPREPARVVCLGNLDRVKGTELITRVMQLDAEHGGRFAFHFLGRKEPGFNPEAWGGICHGAYDRESLGPQLARIGPSFSMIASVWETYCYTLTESWSFGLPVFASNVGALGERIRRHGGGWLLDAGDPRRWYDGMRRVLDSPEVYEEQARKVRSIEIRSVADMATDYSQLYASLLDRPHRAPVAGERVQTRLVRAAESGKNGAGGRTPAAL